MLFFIFWIFHNNIVFCQYGDEYLIYFEVLLADGKKEILKEKLEIDEANMAISMVAVGGHLLEQYKSYKHVIKVIPKDDRTAMLNIKLVYEKFNETDPDPYNYLRHGVSILRDLDTHLAAGQWSYTAILISWCNPHTN